MSIIEKLGITPGPWESSGGYNKIFAKRVGGASMTEQNMNVCDIRGWGCLLYHGEDKAVAEQSANENIISAAPEMLEALIDISEAMEENNLDQSVSYRNDIKMIIEKATGKSWEEIKDLLG